jgi:ABC-2 type transport system permease protein
MEDHFSSIRFLLICALIVMVGVIITSMVAMTIQKGVEGQKPTRLFLLLFIYSGSLFSFVQFIAFFGPLIGIFLGFDSINRERISRTLSKLVSQPIYRDSIINAKFLSGAGIISIMIVAIILIISGPGLRVVGVVPGIEEVLRLVLYLIICIFYISLWLGIAILFSIIFRSTATSALASLAVWIFFSFFISMGANFIANAVAPVSESSTFTGFTTQVSEEMKLKNAEIQRTITLFSPMSLYSEATVPILDPMMRGSKPLLLGPMEYRSMTQFKNPLPFWQSLIIVTPYLISIVAITFVCFAISYLIFMRQEIRTT